MSITIHDDYISVDTLYGCDSIIWNGIYFSNPGTYFDTLSSIYGCDSVIGAHVIIDQSIISTDVIEACDSVVWKNTIYYSNSLCRYFNKYNRL